ncbi:MAG: glycosyltransferase [Chitinivibrionales bacterium]|nr:glycosyltransferase [Chitinivibrionales bacterium]
MHDRKIKIFHFINNIEIGGAETLLLNICRNLNNNEKRYDFRVIILENKQKLREKYDVENIEVVCLDILNKPLLVQIFECFKYIKSNKPDIVHSHLLKTDLPVQIAAFLARRTSTCTIHNMRPFRGKKEKLTGLATSLFAKKIIAVSESAKNNCIKNRMYAGRKIVTIYNSPSFDIGTPAPKALSSGRTIKLLNIGSLSKQKGQEFLIKSMDFLKNDVEMELNIYGSGELFDYLMNIIEQEEKKKVFIRNPVLDIKNVIAETDFFISSSLWEGFPLAAVEAISMGIPTILSDIPPHRELFQDYPDYPLFIEPGKKVDIFSHIKRLTEDPDFYHDISQTCINQSKRYSHKELTGNYNRFYISLIE